MNRIKQILVSLLVVVLAASCASNTGPDKNPEVKFKATLNSANQIQVPRVISSATGTMEGVYNKDKKTMAYTVTFTGLVPTVAHFHNAPSFQNGLIVKDLGRPTGNTYNGSVELSQKEENDLFAGNWYVNLHTTAHPAGEIRGNLIFADYTGR